MGSPHGISVWDFDFFKIGFDRAENGASSEETKLRFGSILTSVQQVFVLRQFSFLRFTMRGGLPGPGGGEGGDGSAPPPVQTRSLTLLGTMSP